LDENPSIKPASAIKKETTYSLGARIGLQKHSAKREQESRSSG